MKTRFTLMIASGALLCAAIAHAQGFKFSQEDNSAKEKAQERAQTIASLLATPCATQLKDKKIMLIIGEQQVGGGILANQDNYGPHFQVINQRLRSLGLKTYTPEEIKKQIAQAEIDAYFKGNPDAALSASRRLGASFVLRGLITSDARVNPVIRVNEIDVNMGFTLADNAGRMIADANAHSAAFSGSDVRGASARLINEQADEVVARLYSDYCSKATVEAKRGK